MVYSLGIINHPNDLIAEKLCVVTGIQVRLGGLRTVELQTLANALAQHVKSWVRFHDLRHGLLD